MDLSNEKVIHIKFGTGLIKSNENGIIKVKFNEEFGDKDFLYPSAFEHFLKLSDPALNNEVQNELKSIINEKTKLTRESELRKEEEQKALREHKKPKVKTAKPGAKKK